MSNIVDMPPRPDQKARLSMLQAEREMDNQQERYEIYKQAYFDVKSHFEQTITLYQEQAKLYRIWLILIGLYSIWMTFE